MMDKPNNEMGVCWDQEYFSHETGSHPESADRLRPLYDRLRAGDFTANLRQIPARKASLEEICTVHDPGYVDYVRQFCEAGGGYIWLDTAASPKSFEVALLASGGFLACLDAVMRGEVSRAFSLGRPPGHHAEADRAMGFCFFNHVAVGARYLQTHHGLDRVLIVDWDVHHGNGTENTFLNDDSVLYISIHQSPCYPGTGPVEEIGQGEGVGCNVNIPLPPGCGDETYLAAFGEIVLPMAQQFRPEFILVSAGMDAHYLDPLANMRVTSPCFGAMGQMLQLTAESFGKGRLAFCLEGGYNAQALASSFDAVCGGLEGEGGDPWNDSPEPPDLARRVLEAVKEEHSPYWDLS